MKKIIYLFSLSALMSLTVACEDFFDTDSDRVSYVEKSSLKGAQDTIYYLTGILEKLQAIGDRTVLLGEARGDLVDVTSYTASDLRDVATFNVGDDNMYNVPRDYYAVINNCNYFIANADTALKNSRNEYLFRAEYAAVKAIRAWTYLQLVTTYGEVPFVTEPILTKEEAERAYPRRDIQGICNYFLNEDGLTALADVAYPSYDQIKGISSRLFLIPMYLVLGDLNLWAGNYLQAAQCYYNYIARRNGSNSTYATSLSSIRWTSSDWLSASGADWILDFADETNKPNSEIIFLIGGDSIPSEGNYSRLRTIFNTSADNDFQASLVPSQGLMDLSAAQKYCHYERGEYTIAPSNLYENTSGDLRLAAAWSSYEAVRSNGDRYSSQRINKYLTGHVHIYRRQMVYLRMAEALNRAGYPRFAFEILRTGLNNSVIENMVIPYYRADSALLAQFDFPNTRYILDRRLVSGIGANTQGIHSRGSGYSEVNWTYTMPVNPDITDSLAQIAWQQEQVEDLIMDEEALELAFEGHRFYDLMRVALRRQDPSYLAKRIYARRGAGSDSGIAAGKLEDTRNWYLRWNGKIGVGL